MEKTRKDWCLGFDVPVEVSLKKPDYLGRKLVGGRATALNPKLVTDRDWHQEKGLFLDVSMEENHTQVVKRDNITAVVVKHTGRDVHRFVKSMYD